MPSIAKAEGSGMASCIWPTTLPISSVKPTPMPWAMYLPTWSRNSREGELMPRALWLCTGGFFLIGTLVDLFHILLGKFRDNTGVPLRQ